MAAEFSMLSSKTVLLRLQQRCTMELGRMNDFGVSIRRNAGEYGFPNVVQQAGGEGQPRAVLEFLGH
jgi:hypothetical protein